MEWSEVALDSGAGDVTAPVPFTMERQGVSRTESNSASHRSGRGRLASPSGSGRRQASVGSGGKRKLEEAAGAEGQWQQLEGMCKRRIIRRVSGALRHIAAVASSPTQLVQNTIRCIASSPLSPRPVPLPMPSAKAAQYGSVAMPPYEVPNEAPSSWGAVAGAAEDDVLAWGGGDEHAGLRVEGHLSRGQEVIGEGAWGELGERGARGGRMPSPREEPAECVVGTPTERKKCSHHSPSDGSASQSLSSSPSPPPSHLSGKRRGRRRQTAVEKLLLQQLAQMQQQQLLLTSKLEAFMSAPAAVSSKRLVVRVVSWTCMEAVSSGPWTVDRGSRTVARE